MKLGRKFKLTAHQQREARARRENGEALSEIARSYNVSHSTISRLRHERRRPLPHLQRQAHAPLLPDGPVAFPTPQEAQAALDRQRGAKQRRGYEQCMIPKDRLNTYAH